MHRCRLLYMEYAKMLMLFFFSSQSFKYWIVPACKSIIVVQEEGTEMS